MDRPNAPVSDKLALQKLSKLYNDKTWFTEGTVRVDVAEHINSVWLNVPFFKLPSESVVVIDASGDDYNYATVSVNTLFLDVLSFVREILVHDPVNMGIDAKVQVAEFDAFAQRADSKVIALTLTTGQTIPLLVQKHDKKPGVFVLSTSLAISPGIAGVLPLFGTLAFTAIMKTRMVFVNYTTPSWLHLLTAMPKATINTLESMPTSDDWVTRFNFPLSEMCIAMPESGLDMNVQIAAVVLNRLIVQKLSYDVAELPAMVNMVMNAIFTVPVNEKLYSVCKTDLGPLMVLGYGAYASGSKTTLPLPLPAVVGPVEYVNPTTWTGDDSTETLFFAQMQTLLSPSVQISPSMAAPVAPSVDAMVTCMMGYAMPMSNANEIEIGKLHEQIAAMQATMDNIQKNIFLKRERINALRSQQPTDVHVTTVASEMFTCASFLPPLPASTSSFTDPSFFDEPLLSTVAPIDEMVPEIVKQKRGRPRLIKAQQTEPSVKTPKAKVRLPNVLLPDVVLPTPVLPTPVLPEPAILPTPVLPEPAPVLPEPAVVPEPVLPTPVVPEPVLPTPVLSEPVLSEPVLSEPVLPEPANLAELEVLLTELPPKNNALDTDFRAKHKYISASTFNAVQNMFSERTLSSPKPIFAFYTDSLKADQENIREYVEQVFGVSWELLTKSVMDKKAKMGNEPNAKKQKF